MVVVNWHLLFAGTPHAYISHFQMSNRCRQFLLLEVEEEEEEEAEIIKKKEEKDVRKPIQEEEKKVVLNEMYDFKSMIGEFT